MEVPGPSAPGPGWRAPRRVATTPTSLHARHEAAAASAASRSSALVETLYYHPNMKIVSFTASARAFSRSPTRGPSGVDKDEVGTLSWSSQLERTIAVGPFRIYRAPASVAFLSCGSALQPILPKSQSWCLDEVNSRFVLQIRRPNYWRLELPVDDPEDQKLAYSLRAVLDNVLQFEKTPCPFKRAFTVTLPELPQEPVKKKPWKPVRRSLPDISGPVTPTTPTGRPIDAAVIHTARIPERVIDDSASTRTPERIIDDSASTSSLGSNTRDSSPAPMPSIDSTMESSTGLLFPKPKTRAVSEGSPTVPLLVKQFNKHKDLVIPTVVPAEKPTLEPPLQEEQAFPEPAPEPVQPTENATQDIHTEAVQEPSPVRPQEPESSNIKNTHDSLQEVVSASPMPQTPDPQELVSDESINLEVHEGAGKQTAQRKVRLRRSTGFGSARLAAPMIRPLIINTTPPALEPSAPVDPAEESGRISPTESEDSFHSVESWHADDAALPPSPPASQFDSKAGRPEPEESAELLSDNESDTSERSVATAPDQLSSTPFEQEEQELAEMGYDASASALSSSLDAERMRPRSRQPVSDGSLRRRALSPLTPAAGIFPSPLAASRALLYNNHLATMKKIPMAIISKTCSIVLGPPLHLIALMLKVAGKIAAGQSRGQEYGYGSDGEQIPVHWDYSDGDISDWDEDLDPTPGPH